MRTDDPKTYLWQNISVLMGVQKPTIDAVQKSTKLGRGTVQRIKAAQTSVGIDVVAQIAASFNRAPWEVLQRMSADQPAAATGYSLGPTLDHAPDLHGPVPLISSVQAGNWREIGAIEVEDWLWSAKPVSPRAFALRVRGDSMTAPYGPSYREGCIIFVDPMKDSPSNGDRIVAKVAGSNEATFKVFKSEDGRTWLAPLNRSHQPILEPFEVIGTVIGQWGD